MLLILVDVVDPRSMHLSVAGSPLVRSQSNCKSDPCASPPDVGSSFSVILRPSDQLGGNHNGDSLSLQRYTSGHPASRLVAVSQSRTNEGTLTLVLFLLTPLLIIFLLKQFSSSIMQAVA